jgi:hypothetical protein
LSQILKGLLIKILIAQKIFATVFWLAKANAKPQIQAQVIKAFTSYHKFEIIVIIQIIQINAIITFFINGNTCLFNQLFKNFSSTSSKKVFIKVFAKISIVNTKETLNTLSTKFSKP